MKITIAIPFLGLSLLLSAGSWECKTSARAEPPLSVPLDSLNGLDVQAYRENSLDPARVASDIATYRGRRALHLINDDSEIGKGNSSGGQSLAVVKDSDFRNGTLEVDVVGWPRAGASPDTRGFVGIAFHVKDHLSRFEVFYLRFTNGRADDQLRRNHTTQYVSEPDFPWFRLRKENPGLYESYVDVEERAWTNIKIVVKGTRASLYINGASEPCLIVNDLKLGETGGQVALWNGSDTEAYFSQLRIR